jgi:myo-inositol-1(or 4)-monophosphatase
MERLHLRGISLLATAVRHCPATPLSAPCLVLSDVQKNELRKFAEHLADLAGEVVRMHYAQPTLAVEIKADGSPVTVADKEAERVMRAAIHTQYPNHGIVGEEYGAERDDAEFCWVLDPVDGTKSFIARVPLFTTLVGLRYQGQPAIGVIDQPILRERAVGDGLTATFNGRPAKVAAVSLKSARLLTTDVENIARAQPKARWADLARQCDFSRTWGDGYGHMMVVAGRAHIMADPIMNPWDLIPVLPVLRGAGATVTAWDGGDPVAAGNAVAAAPELHAEALRILRG